MCRAMGREFESMITKNSRKRWKWVLGLGALALVVSAGAIFGAARIVARGADREVVTEVAALPHKKVALVLGCSPRLGSGQANLFFEHRMDAAAAAWKAGKVDYLLVSGDNHVATYDEPAAMEAALVQRGVPVEKIVRDCAGFSTLDSVVRARKVFGLTECCVITQRDHAERALYLARANGIEAVAYPAADVPVLTGLRTRMRESLARVRTVLDVHVIGRQPHFLGARIVIGEH